MKIKKPSPDTMKEQAVRQAKDLLITVLILTAATGSHLGIEETEKFIAEFIRKKFGLSD